MSIFDIFFGGQKKEEVKPDYYEDENIGYWDSNFNVKKIIGNPTRYDVFVIKENLVIKDIPFNEGEEVFTAEGKCFSILEVTERKSCDWWYGVNTKFNSHIVITKIYQRTGKIQTSNPVLSFCKKSDLLAIEEQSKINKEYERIALEKAEKLRQEAEAQERERLRKEQEEADERAFWNSPEGRRLRAERELAEIRRKERLEAEAAARRMAEEEHKRQQEALKTLKDL